MTDYNSSRDLPSKEGNEMTLPVHDHQCFHSEIHFCIVTLFFLLQHLPRMYPLLTLSDLKRPLFSEESEFELILEDLWPLFLDVSTVKLSSGGSTPS